VDDYSINTVRRACQFMRSRPIMANRVSGRKSRTLPFDATL